MGTGLSAAPCPPPGSDPLLAGLPQDPDFSRPCLCSPPSPSNAGLPANRKSDTYSGSSSDKTLDYMVHWSRTPEPDALGPAASENTVTSGDWKPGRDSRPRSHGSPLVPNPDSQEHCNDQDLLKRQHNVITKKPLETNSSKVKVKSLMMIPDSQKLLRCELESLKTQLQAQTKAFEFLNHSVTMLEKESCLQQIKIQQLEEVLSPLNHQTDKEGHKWGTEQGREELYGALAQGLQGLRKTLRDSEEGQRARTTRCLQLLAQEIRDSKKFLWEELELLREEVTFIYQKLQAQEEEITDNLVNIQKMQKTQVKCRKVLTKIKQQGCETSSWPETEQMPPGGNGSWRDDLQKELSDIWSAVHVLQNSFDSLTLSSGGHPRAASLRGYKGHRCLSPPLPSWDSDSESDPDPSQARFSKNRSFPPGADPPLPHPSFPSWPALQSHSLHPPSSQPGVCSLTSSPGVPGTRPGSDPPSVSTA
ncbi:PREDICTED: coiled-coil domain-containing protein 159 isoform X1 [Ceratotherium simum simum]|uniref:Coiled-coil domain-containing protein 159 isoform X1 n=2 Tax=Ceratotherium simum simum TaxID=73337 RepID=A0ABM1DKV5_CERSS|nr:PREDICTED: coiled-coil domain-containing protein 159 isoform X1 [Ceratotherium simum simum]